MAESMHWFRWHHGSVTDPKFGVVARKAGARVGDVLAVWAYVLESASTNSPRGVMGPVDHESIEFLLGLQSGQASQILEAMTERGLLAEGGIVAQWAKRQPKRERDDDHSTARTRAHRERLAASGAAPDDQGAPRATTKRQRTPKAANERQGTPRGEERREDRDKGATEVVAGAHTPPSQAGLASSPADSNPDPTPSPGSGAPRATRLQCGFVVPEEWRRWAAAEFPAWPEGVVDLEASKFTDHWAAVPGRAGLKLDWLGTWRNWCRRARPVLHARSGAGHYEAGGAETTYQRSMRERYEQAAPLVAAKAPGASRPNPMEVLDGLIKRVS